MKDIYMEEGDYVINNASKIEKIKKLIIEFEANDKCDRKSLLNSIKKIAFDN